MCSLTFLLRCRDTGTTPKFLRLKRTFDSTKARRIYDRSEKSLLRERIQQLRRDIAKNEAILLKIHLQLSATVNRKDWQKLDWITYNTSRSWSTTVTKRH